MFVRAVRGAVQIEEDSVSPVVRGVGLLVNGLLEKNSINVKNIISIQFTVTEDIQSKNPAAALRTFGFQDVPLFCSQEPKIAGSMPRIVRILMTVETDSGNVLQPLYINGAEKLRPDLVS